VSTQPIAIGSAKPGFNFNSIPPVRNRAATRTDATLSRGARGRSIFGQMPAYLLLAKARGYLVSKPDPGQTMRIRRVGPRPSPTESLTKGANHRSSQVIPQYATIPPTTDPAPSDRRFWSGL
jgi:hypothetical protein